MKIISKSSAKTVISVFVLFSKYKENAQVQTKKARRTSEVKKTRASDGEGSDETLIVRDLLAGVQPVISSNVYVA